MFLSISISVITKLEFAFTNFCGFEILIRVPVGMISFGLGILVAFVGFSSSFLSVTTKLPEFVSAGGLKPEPVDTVVVVVVVSATDAGPLKIHDVAAKNITRMAAATIAARAMYFQGSGLADLLPSPPAGSSPDCITISVLYPPQRFYTFRFFNELAKQKP